MAHDVFISHSSKDKAIADAICASLEANGIRCWIAPRDIKSGQQWPEAIANAIESSRIMVLIFSSNSNNSNDVANELILAVESKNVIIPFKIDDIAPTGIMQYYLIGTHWLDAMNPPIEKQISKLANTVAGLLKEQTTVPSKKNQESESKQISRFEETDPEPISDFVEKRISEDKDGKMLLQNVNNSFTFKSKRTRLIISLACALIVLAVGVYVYQTEFIRAEKDTIQWFDMKYSGELKESQPHGQGEWHHPDGDHYVGEFRDGMEHGYGKMIYSTGAVYEGEWAYGWPHGSGTYSEVGELEYEGDWYEGLPHGHGTAIYFDSESYTGEWKDGLFDGYGTYYWPTGEIYEGEWKEGLEHGEGTLTYPDGEKYFGEWKWGLPHGWGTWSYPDGEKYVGEWEDGQMHGYGTWTGADGTSLEGEWKKGEFIGEGSQY